MFDIDHIESVLPEFVTFASPSTNILNMLLLV